VWKNCQEKYAACPAKAQLWRLLRLIQYQDFVKEDWNGRYALSIAYKSPSTGIHAYVCDLKTLSSTLKKATQWFKRLLPEDYSARFLKMVIETEIF